VLAVPAVAFVPLGSTPPEPPPPEPPAAAVTGAPELSSDPPPPPPPLAVGVPSIELVRPAPPACSGAGF